MSELKQILTRARELITTHGWIQNSYGNETKGFCLFGAVDAAAYELRETKGEPLQVSITEIMMKLRSVSGHKTNAISWNDAPDRTKEEVLTLIDEVLSIQPLVEADTAE